MSGLSLDWRDRGTYARGEFGEVAGAVFAEIFYLHTPQAEK